MLQNSEDKAINRKYLFCCLHTVKSHILEEEAYRNTKEDWEHQEVGAKVGSPNHCYTYLKTMGASTISSSKRHPL